VAPAANIHVAPYAPSAGIVITLIIHRALWFMETMGVYMKRRMSTAKHNTVLCLLFYEHAEWC